MGHARAKPAASGKIAIGEKRRAKSARRINMAIGEKRGSRFRKKDGTIAVYPGGRHKRGAPRRRLYETKDAKISRIELALDAAKKRITVLENENTALTKKEAVQRDLLQLIPDPKKGEDPAHCFGRWEEYRRWMLYVYGMPSVPDVPPGKPPPEHSNLFDDNHLQLPRPPPML